MRFYFGCVKHVNFKNNGIGREHFGKENECLDIVKDLCIKDGIDKKLVESITTQRSEHKTREPELVLQWDKVLEKRNALNQKSFKLHDGPPYANGDLHESQSKHCGMVMS